MKIEKMIAVASNPGTGDLSLQNFCSHTDQLWSTKMLQELS